MRKKRCIDIFLNKKLIRAINILNKIHFITNKLKAKHMKKILLICLATMIVGCQQSKFGELVATNQLKEANKKIRTFLSILDDPNADKNDQENVLCLMYPKIYKYEYLPSILRLTKLKIIDAKPKDQLLDDLRKTTETYSKKLNITCD